MSQGKGKEASVLVKLQLIEDYEHQATARLVAEHWAKLRIEESVDSFLTRMSKAILRLSNAQAIENTDGTITYRVYNKRSHAHYEYGTYRVGLGDDYEAPEFENTQAFFDRKKEELRKQAGEQVEIL